ncbi:MAG: hypothetical protein F8N37_13210 [Telmatospirillum sp.]|nr:hypothetical protein [Telmatospirillum sp.]
MDEHNGISIRMATAVGYLRWELRSPEGRDMRVRVKGQAAFNTAGAALTAAVDGLGLAFVPQELAAPFLADGRLIVVLAGWCALYEG